MKKIFKGYGQRVDTQKWMYVYLLFDVEYYYLGNADVELKLLAANHS